MDQPGNNHLLLRTSQSAPAAYNGNSSYNGLSGHNGASSYNGQPAVADRMRELLARTVHDHIVEERSVASALHEIRLRLDAIDKASASGAAGTVDGLTATIDGLAATIGALDSKLAARLERLDERLDDQYDRVRSVDGKLENYAAGVDGKLENYAAGMEETVTKAVEAATADIIARIASLEDTVLTLAEALLRPSIRVPRVSHAPVNGSLNGHG
jgi:hypothetical protein